MYLWSCSLVLLQQSCILYGVFTLSWEHVTCQKLGLLIYEQHVCASVLLLLLLWPKVKNLFIDPPSGNPVIDNKNSPPVFYKDDNIEMTCSVSGGLPPANLSWDCPGLTSISQRGNSSHSWLVASGTATRALNGKSCRCTAQHYAWLPLESNLRTVQTPNITVYCKY